MKLLPTLLLSAAILALSLPAYATVREFGPEGIRATLDIPDTWKVSTSADGIQANAPDNQTFISVTNSKTEGKTAREIGAAIAIKLQGKPKLDQASPDTCLVTTTNEFGMRFAVLIMVDGDNCYTARMAGKDLQGVSKILESIKAK